MPLMYRDSSEAKNTAAFATSMAVPICPVGDSASRAATIAPTDSYAPLMPFIVHAAVRTLQRFPKVNATIDLDAGVIRCADGERIGIAVDTPRGLLVPVIKDGGGLGVGRLAAVIGELGTKARDGGLTLADLAGGSFTVTNYGSVGTLFDTPIINMPQVAILGTGAIVRRPVVVSDAQQSESIDIRDMMYLSLSYDHRLVDGADAARFLGIVKALLEAGDFEV